MSSQRIKKEGEKDKRSKPKNKYFLPPPVNANQDNFCFDSDANGCQWKREHRSTQPTSTLLNFWPPIRPWKINHCTCTNVRPRCAGDLFNSSFENDKGNSCFAADIECVRTVHDIGWQKLDMHCARDVSASISRKHRNEIIMDLYGLNPWEFSRQKSGFYCATFLFAPTTTRTHRLPANNPSFIGRSNFILRGKFPPSPPWNYGNYCQL